MAGEIDRDVATKLKGIVDSLVIIAGTDDSDNLNYQHVDSDGAALIKGMVDGSIDIEIGQVAIEDTPEFFEDISFVTGDSPVTLDINNALGRNATKGYIINDGDGNFTVAFSTNGSAFGDAITMKKNEVVEFENISVDSLKITWVADSAYRVSVI